MSINLKEAVDFLLTHGYLYKSGIRFKVATKLYSDLSAGSPKPIDWVGSYTKFIVDAEIPNRAESRNGEYYPLNKFSEPGCRAFRKAIEGGADYTRLVQSTRLYYRSGVRLKVAITRYMDEGLWRSDYEALVLSEEKGTTLDHVKTQESDGTHSSWTVG